MMPSSILFSVQHYPMELILTLKIHELDIWNKF